MNHSGIETTARFYAQDDDDAKKKAQGISILGDTD